MPAIKLDKFGGMLPAWDEHELPDGQADNSVNSYLFSGALIGWRAPKFLRNLTNPAAGKVFRIPNITVNANGVETFNNDITQPSMWLEFDDIDTDVVKSQVVNDQFQRYYWASPSQGPPKYNTYNRMRVGLPAFNLGIPPPGCPPTVEVSGGGNTAQLGFTTSNGGQTTVPANCVYMFPIVPIAALALADVQFMPNVTDAAVQFQAVVYQDAVEGGTVPTAPGQIVGVGAPVVGITAGTLADSAFVNPPGLNANTPYWIGIAINTAEKIATGDGNTGSVLFSNAYANGPPGFAPGVTPGQFNLQMYADLNTTDPYEARSYVYTYVSAYGEESPPSQFTLVNGWSNGIWTIGLSAPPTNQWSTTGWATGVANLAIIRIYRTVSGAAGSTVYFWVADVSIGSTDQDALAAVSADTAGQGCFPPSDTYQDTQSDAVIALNAQMPSTNYYPPPNGLYTPTGAMAPLAPLQGLTALPNGMYVGFINNQVWFSTPYLPHAWPPGQNYTTDFPIVGIGHAGGQVIVCTAAHPWIMTGTSPTQMSMTKCAQSEPCTSRGSIVSLDNGVFYISPNGLIQVSGVSASNTSDLWIKRENWAQLVPQKYTRAILLSSMYFCFGSAQNGDASVAQQGFNIELAQDNTSFTIWPQPGGHRVGFNKMLAPNAANVTNIQQDVWTSYGLMIQNGAVYWWDFLDSQPTIMPYDWTSKTYQQNAKRSYEAMRCFFQVPPGSPTPGPRNVAPADDPSWQTLSANAYAYILVYADPQQEGANTGQLTLVAAREVQRSGELLRIGDGFKAENWYWRILGRVNISNIQVATSVKELANV